MKILVTGANGSLAGDLIDVLESKHELLALTRHDLDITDEQAVSHKIKEFKPQFLLNTAALTDVDTCEQDMKKATAVNGWGPYYLAKACRDNNCALIHFSTEMIFDGTKTKAYGETDCPNPLSVYGLSKYVGEQNIKRSGCRHTIFRTSWLFGGGTPKFVDKFIAKTRQQEKVAVVRDHFGSPTFTRDIAGAITLYLEEPVWGTFHLVNSGMASRIEMAKFIQEQLNLRCKLVPVDYQDLGLQTFRPARALLKSLYRENHRFLQLRSWQEALNSYLSCVYSNR